MKLQKRDISELRPAELRTMVEDIRRILWFDFAKEKWDPDKESNIETLEYVAGVLDDHGLRPAEEEIT